LVNSKYFSGFWKEPEIFLRVREPSLGAAPIWKDLM